MAERYIFNYSPIGQLLYDIVDYRLHHQGEENDPIITKIALG